MGKTITVTGAHGFIGRNLVTRIKEAGKHDVVDLHRSSTESEMRNAAARSDVVFHLAGVNRPQDNEEFLQGNVRYTETLCAALAYKKTPSTIVYASSTQAAGETEYGRSKLAAEQILQRYGQTSGSPIVVFRLPNVFGKWARPNYNSVVATFCEATVKGGGLTVHEAAAPLDLVYIDDLVDAFLALLDEDQTTGFREIPLVHHATVGGLARIISSFPEMRAAKAVPGNPRELRGALYATYCAYLAPKSFTYHVPIHTDRRGAFVEMIRDNSLGQVSYFTARPGQTRGEHYHHSKVERFLVAAGKARFDFRNIETGQIDSQDVVAGQGCIVEVAPGWTHAVRNVGDEDLVVLIWSNECFDPARPDTVAMKV